MATPAGNSTPLSGESYVDGLLSGDSWQLGSDRVLTVSGHDESGLVTDSEIVSGLLALLGWESVANISFQVLDTNELFENSPADIAVVATPLTTGGGILFGFAGFPDLSNADAMRASVSAQFAFEFNATNYPNPAGDVFINDLDLFGQFDAGERGIYVVIHELGHALGLKHPHDGGGNDRPTFTSLGISDLDSTLWTVMSYETSANPYGVDIYPVTPMPGDILAIQHLYGPNMDIATGDDMYWLADDGVTYTIWDGGGTDTINATQLLRGVTIDLSEEVPYIDSTYANVTFTAIAYGVVIENVTGSNFDDLIIGNSESNLIYGQTGNDTTKGKGGNDILIGGSGNDTILGAGGTDDLRGAGGDDVYKGGPGADLLRETPGEGKDSFVFDTKLGSGNFDSIEGFSHKYDTIKLDDDIFKKLSTGNIHALPANQYKENSTGNATDADDRIIYNNVTGDLYYDSDGNGPTAAIKFAVIDGGPDSVNYTDFTIII